MMAKGYKELKFKTAVCEAWFEIPAHPRLWLKLAEIQEDKRFASTFQTDDDVSVCGELLLCKPNVTAVI